MFSTVGKIVFFPPLFPPGLKALSAYRHSGNGEGRPPTQTSNILALYWHHFPFHVVVPPCGLHIMDHSDRIFIFSVFSFFFLHIHPSGYFFFFSEEFSNLYERVCPSVRPSESIFGYTQNPGLVLIKGNQEHKSWHLRNRSYQRQVLA